MVPGISQQKGPPSNSVPGLQPITTWEDVICPICLAFPHNCVLLQCSSYEKGCLPLMCDTGYAHSNCLERYRAAYGVPATQVGPSRESTHSVSSDGDSQPKCPLCRGDVTGWIVVEEARVHLNMKGRCCEEKNCTYVGNYVELQQHSRLEHPNSRPSEVNPAQKLDWENLQQSSELVDVLSTIHSEVPRAVVLGDYVIEYGNDDNDAETGDEYEDFPGDDGNWWTSCVLYQAFENFRSSRNRRRSRVTEPRMGRRRRDYEPSNFEASTSSIDTTDYGFDETDDEFMGMNGGGGGAATASRGSASHRRFQRRRSQSHEP